MIRIYIYVYKYIRIYIHTHVYIMQYTYTRTYYAIHTYIHTYIHDVIPCNLHPFCGRGSRDGSPVCSRHNTTHLLHHTIYIV